MSVEISTSSTKAEETQAECDKRFWQGVAMATPLGIIFWFLLAYVLFHR